MFLILQLLFLLFCSALSIVMLWVPLSSHMQAMAVMSFLHYSLVAVGCVTGVAVLLWRDHLNKLVSFIYLIFIAANVLPNFFHAFIYHDMSHMAAFPVYAALPISSIYFFIAAPVGGEAVDASGVVDGPGGSSTVDLTSSGHHPIDRHNYRSD